MDKKLCKLLLLGGVLIVFIRCISLLNLDEPLSKEEAIRILLSEDPPESLTDIDYHIRCGFEGCYGSLCGQISESDFRKLISKLSNKIDLKKTEPDDLTEVKRNFYHLKCWKIISDKADLYYSRWRNSRTTIWYQNNKINIHRKSY
jgi:hypothetical protein